MRLDKLLSRLGEASRSECKALLKAGRVKVNGEACRDGAFSVPEGARVTVGLYVECAGPGAWGKIDAAILK